MSPVEEGIRNVLENQEVVRQLRQGSCIPPREDLYNVPWSCPVFDVSAFGGYAPEIGSREGGAEAAGNDHGDRIEGIGIGLFGLDSLGGGERLWWRFL